MYRKLIAVDPGSSMSGVVVIEDGLIVKAGNIRNGDIMPLIADNISGPEEGIVLIEDIKPYSVKLNSDVIDTCKFIGECSYRLRVASILSVLIYRWEIKKWAFDAFEEARNRVDKKILTGKFLNKDGEPRKSSFVFVDDRIMIAVMKEMWGIETPKPGKTNRYALSSHAWQALAVASFYISLHTDPLVQDALTKTT